MKISCRFEISFRSTWPIWNPYRFEFHFASIHGNASKELTEHRSEIFNRNEISYRSEFISPHVNVLLTYCSKYKNSQLKSFYKTVIALTCSKFGKYSSIIWYPLLRLTFIRMNHKFILPNVTCFVLRNMHKLLQWRGVNSCKLVQWRELR